MKLPRIMIAAPGSGSGKTLLTCGILGMLKKENKDVIAYKCGPDYIDPMFHRTVLEIETENLDTFFTGEEGTKELFCQTACGRGISVMEGVMGLYDGLGGVREEGSAYHLAKVTKTPIILVVDVRGMGKSMIPLIKGFKEYDTENLIKGIILNRISKSFFDTMKPLIEDEIDIPVLGYFPNRKEIHLENRHLGLVMPEEIVDIKEQLKIVTEQVYESIDIEKLLNIANGACELDYQEQKEEIKTQDKLRIAIARDKAFCFYYNVNIRELEKHNIQICYFSPLEDEKLPDNIDGLLLGGGYPELYVKELSANESMRKSIRSVIEGGIPLLAECGGFMYLHKSITDKDEKEWPMVGVIDGSINYQGKLVRFGYIEIEEKSSEFLHKDGKIKAHEFHYFDSTNNGDGCIATKPVTGKNWDCIHKKENWFVGFPHLYYLSAPEFVDHFAECMRIYKEKK